VVETPGSERKFWRAVAIVVAVLWLAFAGAVLHDWSARLYFVSLTAILGSVAWLSVTWRRDFVAGHRGPRGWLPWTIAFVGLWIPLFMGGAENGQHVTTMDGINLIFAAASLAAYRLLHRRPASAVSQS
jgi:hypothetical protein